MTAVDRRTGEGGALSVTSSSLAGAGENLRALVDRVWRPATDGASPVTVTTGPPPRDHVAVETYAIVPHPARARFLLPLDTRRAAVASVWKYHSMKGLRTQAAAVTLAATLQVGAFGRLFPHRLVVSVDRRLPVDEYAEWLVLRHLARELDIPPLLAGIAVRRTNPNAKPTLQLFDASGEPRAYAKLGWSEATREMIRTESDALVELDGRLKTLITPRLLAKGSWGDITYSVASPLPEELRRWTREPTAAPEVNLEVARSTAVTESTVLASAHHRRLRRDLDSTASVAPEATRVLGEWLHRLERHGTPLAFGRWHGDWVPWNLGQLRSRPAAWDWEHSAADVPIGFDLLHWHFQQKLSTSDLPAAVATTDKASHQLAVLGVPPASHALVVSLYLLEMFVRNTKLSVGGGGWNPKIHPAMLAVAANRDHRTAEH